MLLPNRYTVYMSGLPTPLKTKFGQNMAMLDVLAGEMAGAEVGNQLP